jgi:hypothetical protein
VNRDIPDNAKAPYFLESFTPSEGVETLPVPLNFVHDKEGIKIDCPFCHGDKSLYLTGKPVRGDIESI